MLPEEEAGEELCESEARPRARLEEGEQVAGVVRNGEEMFEAGGCSKEP